MQSCYNCTFTLPYPKFTFDHVHLLSDGTIFLFGWVHFPFRFVKKTFEGCLHFILFSVQILFIRILSIRMLFFSFIYCFHSYTFHLCPFFHSSTFNPSAFHSYTFHSYAFLSYTFHLYTFLSYTILSFVYFSFVYFSFVYSTTHMFSCKYCGIFKNLPSAKDCFWFVFHSCNFKR